MANDSRLGILLEARDNTKPGFISAERNMGDLKSAAGNLTGGFGALVKAGTAVGVALAATKLAEAAYEMGKAAAQVDRLKVSFEGLARGAGVSGNALLSAMRKAADGTIADAELIASANRAMLLGVADSADEMTQLLEVASARGKAMGLSTAQAFSDLVTGIGRMSPLILDNLGIITGGEKVFKDYAASIGRAADSLTDAEKKQALLNKVVSESQTMIDDNAASGRDMATSFERMDASIQNAKDALGALFSPAAAAIAEKIASATDAATDAMLAMAGVTDPYEAINDSMRLFNVLLTNSNSNTEMGRAALASMGEQYNALAGKLGRPMIDVIASASAGMVVFSQVSVDTAIQLSALAGETDSTAVAFQHMAKMAAQAGPNVDALRQRIQELAGELRDIQGVAASAASSLRSSFLGIADTVGGAKALQGYQEAKKQLDGQVAIYQALGLGAEEIEFRIQGMVEGVRSTNSELERTLTATDGISKGVSDAEKAFDSLRSKAEGLLSGSLSSGIDLDSILPRQDSIEEDARRLADVAVNGFSSPWASYLNDKFPELFSGAFENGGDIKGMAASVLRDFEDGLRPELLDKDAAKERIKRMLVGEANLRDLATEITNELSQEMQGVSLGDIKSAVGSALGTSDGSPEAGAAFGDGFLSGATGGNFGMKAVAALVDQIKGQNSVVKTAGGSTGKIWGEGFLATVGESIPAALIDLLVRLTTPGVFAQLQQHATLTGTVD